ncbi:MAG: hypothetical protein EHM45_12420 [Desulfobacteraceae bacterium]|nr:MAG: hypothetical protein EHM45_12420 [Desulfobacteraceae bacterium]
MKLEQLKMKQTALTERQMRAIAGGQEPNIKIKKGDWNWEWGPTACPPDGGGCGYAGLSYKNVGLSIQGGGSGGTGGHEYYAGGGIKIKFGKR